jgi:hypothetical protein
MIGASDIGVARGENHSVQILRGRVVRSPHTTDSPIHVESSTKTIRRESFCNAEQIQAPEAMG